MEHDPEEILEASARVIREAMAKARATHKDLVGIGITNQRETVLAWEPESGLIRHNAIVWQDLRGAELINKLKGTSDVGRMQRTSGLVPSPYFSASKIAWMLEHVDGLRSDAESGKVVFGTIDTFLVWSLTGGPGKGVVVTDATNASRYLLMDIEKLEWDDWLLELFAIPKASLPRIVNSFGETYGKTVASGPAGPGIPVCGILGDQQAALFGQACLYAEQGKSTYGTGCFLLTNTGSSSLFLLARIVDHRRLQGGRQATFLCARGLHRCRGILVQWVRDNLKIVKSALRSTSIAESVPDCGGVYIVPAFSGLFAPYWRSDARGVIAGLTGYVTDAHICRAVLESTAFQVKDIFDAMEADSGISVEVLKVDGGLTNSRPLMEFQADLLGIPVIRPQVFETTALGAAYAAGLSTGFWGSFEELASHWREKSRWVPAMDDATRQQKVRFWNKAIQRTLDWETDGIEG